jgi:histidine phosphotransfer protein HptB
MAYDPGALNSTLAAVVGDDPALAAELRAAFVDSVFDALAAMRYSAGESEWIEAAQRMKGLAASFGAIRLMATADEAEDMPPGDPALLRRIERIIGGF